MPNFDLSSALSDTGGTSGDGGGGGGGSGEGLFGDTDTDTGGEGDAGEARQQAQEPPDWLEGWPDQVVMPWELPAAIAGAEE